jgi:putative intracellular protease/amidase
MKLAIALCPGFTTLDAVGPYEILCRLPDTETVFVAEQTGEVHNDAGSLAIVADASFADVDAADVLVVPGGPGSRAHLDALTPVVSWIRRIHSEGAYVVAASRKSSAGLEALDSPNLVHAAGCFMDDWVPETVVDRAVEAFGGLDILVDNAGGPSPGVVRTPWWTDKDGVADVIAAHAGLSREQVRDEMLPEALRLTTGRFVEPQEIADVIALLVSPRSGSTTGADFVVDGGLLKEL